MMDPELKKKVAIIIIIIIIIPPSHFLKYSNCHIFTTIIDIDYYDYI